VYGDGSLQSRGGRYVKRNIEASICNHCCSGKAISIIYCECVFVALGIQHARRVRLIMSSAACPALQYFCTLSQNGTILKKCYCIKMCVSILIIIIIIIIIIIYNFRLKHSSF